MVEALKQAGTFLQQGIEDISWSTQYFGSLHKLFCKGSV